MERRTQPGYEYHSCDFMDDGVYIDMNLLRECEDTGLTPPEILELKERDSARAPETRCEYDDAWFCKNPDCKTPVLTSTMLGAHPSGCPKIYEWNRRADNE